MRHCEECGAEQIQMVSTGEKEATCEPKRHWMECEYGRWLLYKGKATTESSLDMIYFRPPRFFTHHKTYIPNTIHSDHMPKILWRKKEKKIIIKSFWLKNIEHNGLRNYLQLSISINYAKENNIHQLPHFTTHKIEKYPPKFPLKHQQYLPRKSPTSALAQRN